LKIVLQRVLNAFVEVGGETVGRIGKGYVVFLGVMGGDDEKTVERLVDKVAKLRIFADEGGKTNLAASDVGGEILVISQFTLAADLSSNRPSFSRAADAGRAKALYEYFLKLCKGKFACVQSGQFAAHMHVYADNDGPFTLVLE